MAPTALQDVRVLDLTSEMGHYAGKLLADRGADVVRVEPPGGDTSRGRLRASLTGFRLSRPPGHARSPRKPDLGDRFGPR